MSWQSYVDGNLVGSGNVSKGAIIGLDGSIWSISPDFKLAPEECKAIVAGFASASDLFSKGLYISGEKNVLIRADERTLNGRLGQTGVFCVKTNQCILVACYNENIQPGAASMTVEGLADYLISVGY